MGNGAIPHAHVSTELNTTIKKIYDQYKTFVQTDQGEVLVLQMAVEREGKAPLVAQWGGISLSRKEQSVLNDQPAPIWNGRSELLQQLTAHQCELYDSAPSEQLASGLAY